MKQSYPTYSLATVPGDSSRAHPLSSAAGLWSEPRPVRPLTSCTGSGQRSGPCSPRSWRTLQLFPAPFPGLAVVGARVLCQAPVCHLHSSHTSSRPRAYECWGQTQTLGPSWFRPWVMTAHWEGCLLGVHPPQLPQPGPRVPHLWASKAASWASHGTCAPSPGLHDLLSPSNLVQRPCL